MDGTLVRRRLVPADAGTRIHLVRMKSRVAIQIVKSQQSRGSSPGPCGQKAETLPTAPTTPPKNKNKL